MIPLMFTPPRTVPQKNLTPADAATLVKVTWKSLGLGDRCLLTFLDFSWNLHMDCAKQASQMRDDLLRVGDFKEAALMERRRKRMYLTARRRLIRFTILWVYRELVMFHGLFPNGVSGAVPSDFRLIHLVLTDRGKNIERMSETDVCIFFGESI